MAGLKLRLKAHERILINGIVVENGDRPCELSVMSQGAHILRLRDALHPNEVRTPVTRVCYIAQLAVAGEVDGAEALEQLKRGISQLLQVFLDPQSQGFLTEALAEAQAMNFYKTMQSLRRLLPLEEKLLARAAKSTPTLALPHEPAREITPCSA